VKQTRWSSIVPVTVFILLVALTSCGSGPRGRAPTVTIDEPATEVTMEVGEPLQISYTATARAGVAWTEMYVNDRVVRSHDVPGPNPPSTVSVSHTWSPVAEGDVTIRIVAHDTDLAASEPAVLTVHVQCTALSCEAPVVTQATGLTLPMSSLLDLDTGAVCDQSTSEDADLWWKAGLEGAAISGMHGVMLADLGVGEGLPEPGACFSAAVSEPSIQTPLLQPGHRLCFSTTDGNLAAVYVEELNVPGDHDLVLSFVTWQESP